MAILTDLKSVAYFNVAVLIAQKFAAWKRNRHNWFIVNPYTKHNDLKDDNPNEKIPFRSCCRICFGLFG